jgi:secreted PhoX family phosphatase
MHITTTRVMLGAATAAVLGVSTIAPAQADPSGAKNALPLQISCDNGQSYDAVANGNGAWTPAHDLNSSSILVPVSFGTVTVTIRDPQGNIVDQETQPPSAKPGASANNRHATTNCEFVGTATAPDGSTFTIEGTVVGFVTPN